MLHSKCIAILRLLLKYNLKSFLYKNDNILVWFAVCSFSSALCSLITNQALFGLWNLCNICRMTGMLCKCKVWMWNLNCHTVYNCVILFIVLITKSRSLNCYIYKLAKQKCCINKDTDMKYTHYVVKVALLISTCNDLLRAHCDCASPLHSALWVHSRLGWRWAVWANVACKRAGTASPVQHPGLKRMHLRHTTGRFLASDWSISWHGQH